MLNLEQMLTIESLQKKLDEKIAQTKNIKNHDQTTLTARFVALLVEISEFANEQRCFKYWSKKPTSEKSILLEEYIDGFHFVISIANSLNLSMVNCQISLKEYHDLNLAFLELYDLTLLFFKNQNLLTFNNWLNTYYSIAQACNFTGIDIFEGYLAKNKINHLRQEQNY